MDWEKSKPFPPDMENKTFNEGMLYPEYLKQEDKELKRMVDRIQQIISKLHVHPFHQAPQGVADKEDLVRNLQQIKEEKALLMEDLKDVTDVIRQIISKTSISFLVHQKHKFENENLDKVKKVNFMDKHDHTGNHTISHDHVD